MGTKTVELTQDELRWIWDALDMIIEDQEDDDDYEFIADLMYKIDMLLD